MPAGSSSAAVLPRTLGLRDLVLLKLVAVINVSLVAPVAGYGRLALVLWLLAFLCFFVPQAVAVVALSRRWPSEGGIYLWTRRRFGDRHGFLSGWCYWTNNLFYIPMQLVFIAGIAAFAAGPDAARLIEAKWFVSVVALGWLAVITALHVRGMAVGKWVQNAGACGTAFMIVLVIAAGAEAASSGAAPVPVVAGTAGDLFAAFGVMCFAFVGFELASTMGDEIDRPERNLPRAIVIAGAVTLAAFIGLTAAMQALVPVEEIEAIQGVMQALATGFTRAGTAWLIAPVSLAIALSVGGGASAWFAGSARVPFVAGLERALPPALGRVHPRWGSPYVALLINAALSAVLVGFTFSGSTVNEAYQVLLKAGLVIQLIPFVYMFAALAGLRDTAASTRIAGLVGLATTALGIAAAFIPTDEVDSVLVFEIKMALGVIVPIAVGLFFFARSHQAAQRPQALVRS